MKHLEAQKHVNPNLIPMIDIMFLLLLFFMLGADMGHRELEQVRLPESREATEDRPHDRLTINASHKEQAACPAYRDRKICRDEGHWEVVFRGKNCTEPDVLARALSETEGSVPLADRRVMIRADAGAPYG